MNVKAYIAVTFAVAALCVVIGLSIYNSRKDRCEAAGGALIGMREGYVCVEKAPVRIPI